jgi:hypothetical protein
MATQITTAPAKPRSDVLFALGMAAVALAAAVSSYSGLASLADLAGWNHRLALLLPVTIDAYAMTATRAWLSPLTPWHARRWARRNAIGAILTSVVGNGIAHAAHAGEFHVGWPIVVAVSAIPSIVLGLITHLWHLRNTPDTEPNPGARPEPTTAPAAGAAPKPTATVLPAPSAAPTAGATGGPGSHGPRRSAGGARRATGRGSTGARSGSARTDTEVLDEARLLATQLGGPLTATRMVRELHIGTGRAARLAAVLAAETIPTDTPATADQGTDGGESA